MTDTWHVLKAALLFSIIGQKPGLVGFNLHFMQSDYYYIKELVDSLCRDGADAQYMQYLSNSRITSSSA